MAKRIILQLLIVIVIVGCDGTSATRTLTVQETMDPVFFRPIDGPGPHHAYRSANPEALEPLRRVVKDSTLKPYHQTAWMMIGVLGDQSDVPRIREAVSHDFGAGDNGDKQAAWGALLALGLLHGRDVPGAADLFRELMTIAYWEPLCRNRPVERQTKDHRPHALLFYFVGHGYSYSGKHDLDDQLNAEIEKAQRPAEYEYLKGMLSRERRDELYKTSQRAKADDKEAALKSSKDRWNGDLEHPGPTTQPMQ